MKKNLLIVGVIVIVGLVALVAYVLRPPAEATAPIEAIPLATATTAPVSEAPVADPTQEETVATSPTAALEAYPAPGVEAVQAEAYPAPESGAGAILFTIAQAESEARFTLTELLNGNPTTVVGTTDQVAGQILVDLNNPAASQLGVIQVNARTLVTDNNNRNRMIRNEILDTEPYEFITFTPTSLAGLPATIAVGETVTFQIIGDLTIRNITQSVTFEATVTLVSIDRLEGLASVVVTRADYSLTIPSVPSVANVSEEVLVEIQFVATP
jgi:polyisoprenoid-binding protein YceI